MLKDLKFYNAHNTDTINRNKKTKREVNDEIVEFSADRIFSKIAGYRWC
jgi:hypothetical protein